MLSAYDKKPVCSIAHSETVRNCYGTLIATVSGMDIWQATYYQSEKMVYRATRIRFKGKILKGGIYIHFKIGKPNFEERAFIKKCKKADKLFPIEEVQVKYIKRG
jgi:hypothetical protein